MSSVAIAILRRFRLCLKFYDIHRCFEVCLTDARKDSYPYAKPAAELWPAAAEAAGYPQGEGSKRTAGKPLRTQGNYLDGPLRIH